MTEQNDENFWPSYVDLMTSLFFVMLVLFVISYFHYSKKLGEVEVMAKEYERIQDLKKSIEKLMQDDNFFVYEENYKRYKLAQEVEFNQDRYQINSNDIKNFNSTVVQLKQTGKKLKSTIDYLINKKRTDTTYKNISYTLIITGRASSEGDTSYNYNLSYKRAYHLYQFWKDSVADFDSEDYHEIIDFQIAGVGVGGLARFPSHDENGNNIESKNRCFLIQIIPKIGEVKNTDL